MRYAKPILKIKQTRALNTGGWAYKHKTADQTEFSNSFLFSRIFQEQRGKSEESKGTVNISDKINSEMLHLEIITF